jgi:hypothetical protein
MTHAASFPVGNLWRWSFSKGAGQRPGSGDLAL